MSAHEKTLRRQVEDATLAADRKMIEVQNALAPDRSALLSPAELVAEVARQLRAADPEQRQILSLKTAVAVSDLMDLSTGLKRQLADVAQEINRLKGHGGAAAAYGRWLGSLPASARH